MAISMKKYVDIRSGINNIRTATEKDLIARIFTKNELMPVEAIEFENAGEVEKFFGYDSEEYQLANRYFNFINKYSRSPRKISFFRDYNGGVNSFMYTTEEIASLERFKEFTAGTFKMFIEPDEGERIEIEIDNIDLSAVTSYEDVAGEIQSLLREYGTENEIADLTEANFTYSNGSFRFELSGISWFDIIDTELIQALGLMAVVVHSKGVADNKSTYSDILDNSYQQNNNFATYAFLDTTINDEGLKEIAEWGVNKHPSEFMFVVNRTADNIEETAGILADIDGVSIELCGDDEYTGKYNFVMPMAITATTDYNKENGTVDYMYTQYPSMAVVVDNDELAKEYDELKINYYGRTQQAGQKLAFYQNGVLQGKYQDQNIFVNEIWLKDALTTKFLNYMLLTPNWYANNAGQAVGQGLIYDVIERAKLNGTITTEKEISENDKVKIYSITADENAWRQIYQLGYYLVTAIEKQTINNQDTYVFKYTLVYSKGDSIKKVEGENILI